MAKQKSREHHWWPVSLQKHWADRNDDVHWITPSGEVNRKRYTRKKIAKKAHGHTVFRGSVWESNFESEFQEADNAIHEVVSKLSAMKPFGWRPAEFVKLFGLFFKRDRHLRDMCRYYQLDEELHRKLLLVLYSVLIRSPARRARYERMPLQFGMPEDAETAKANLAQEFRAAKTKCLGGLLTNQYFVLLHTSRLKPFLFGDGCMDGLTDSLLANRINGRALITLTPTLAVYLCTPTRMMASPNCASFQLPPWQVDWVNETVQIYSRSQLFYRGRRPKLVDAFVQQKFLRHRQSADWFLEMLDEVAGIQKLPELIGVIEHVRNRQL